MISLIFKLQLILRKPAPSMFRNHDILNTFICPCLRLFIIEDAVQLHSQTTKSFNEILILTDNGHG